MTEEQFERYVDYVIGYFPANQFLNKYHGPRIVFCRDVLYASLGWHGEPYLFVQTERDYYDNNAQPDWPRERTPRYPEDEDIYSYEMRGWDAIYEWEALLNTPFLKEMNLELLA